MITGIGMDLIEIARIEAAVERHGRRFLERVFTGAELDYCLGKSTAAVHLAGRFAAKEACAKALGVGIGRTAGWREMEVTRDDAGKPTLVLTGRAAAHAEALGVSAMFLSITHTNSHAAAVAVLER